ncbi:MAG: large protein [Flavipsychrobacter sp.]|nr:large protein [Flavipsychrobacter sp.]
MAQVPGYIDTNLLLAWYPLDGDLMNAHNGPVNNGIGSGPIAYGTGRSGAVNQSYLGNAANGIDIPIHNFPVGNAARSVSVFYKCSLPYASGLHQLIVWGNDSASGHLFGIVVSDSSVGVDYKNGSVYKKVMPDSLWHNVTVTYPANGSGSSSIKLFFDGELSKTTTQGAIGALATDAEHIHSIGTLLYSTNKYSWQGNIDDVGVWGRELTECEVRLAANSYRITMDSVPDSCQTASGGLKANVMGGIAPYHYLWSAANGGDEDSIGALSEGTYTVTVTDASGCVAKAQSRVYRYCLPIIIAEGLSPNGDGLNDHWEIFGLNDCPDNTVQVFDKWGNLVYEQNDYKNDWDGKSKGGSRLPDGDYFYLVKLNVPDVDIRKNVYTGQLLLRR